MKPHGSTLKANLVSRRYIASSKSQNHDMRCSESTYTIREVTSYLEDAYTVLLDSDLTIIEVL